jgi:hypothetical protein
MGRVQVPWCYQICSIHKTFCNVIVFYGGIGECNHKKFVKETGCKTQKRIRIFTSQVAQRYYRGMSLDIAQKSLDIRSNSNKNNHELAHHDDNVEQNITGVGQYKLFL